MATEQSAALTYAQLIDELRRACVEKRSGTMMIATQDNQLARVSLQDGEIVSINYRLKNGREAIPLLRDIKEARVRFSQGRTAAGGDQGGSLPSTVDIMLMLSGDKAAAAPATGTVSTDQVPQALKVIEAELIEVLGPLASIVWTEHLERLGKPVAAGKLRTLVDGLAKEIGDPAKVQAFKDKIWQKLGGKS